MSKRYYVEDYTGVFYRLARRIGREGLEKVFYYTLNVDGKVLEEKAGREYKDKMTAPLAARIRAERIEGIRPSPKEIKKAQKEKKDVWTIDRLWREYKKQRPDVKGIRVDESRYGLYIKSTLGKKEPRGLAPLDLDRVRMKMQRENKSPQTIKLTLALLKRIVNFGHKKRLSQPPSFPIELPKVNNIKTEDLSPDQLKRLLKAIERDTHHQAGDIMKMVLFTGMRRGELFKLRWQDVDFDRGFIHIRDPKGGPDQVIPLNDQARGLLESIKRTRRPFVFPGRGGGQRRDIHKAVNAIRDAAGLPRDFRALHGLRHTYASMLASSGKVDLYTLQKLLTHKTADMTQRYAHLRDEALKQASSVAGNLIQGVMKGRVKKFKVVQIRKRKR